MAVAVTAMVGHQLKKHPGAELLIQTPTVGNYPVLLKLDLSRVTSQTRLRQLPVVRVVSTLNVQSPLMLAAEAGHVSALEVLLTLDADPMGEDGDGNTAMHLAALNGKVEVIQVSRRGHVGKWRSFR